MKIIAEKEKETVDVLEYMRSICIIPKYEPTDMLLFPSMLVAVPMIRETGSFISLFLIIACLIYIEIDILKQKKLKCIQKFLFSIPNILGVIAFMVFFINYE